LKPDDGKRNIFEQLLFGKDQNGGQCPENSHVYCYVTVRSFSTYTEPWDLYLLHSSVKVKVRCRNCVAVRLTYRYVRMSQGHICLQVQKNLKLRNRERERGNAIRLIKTS